jgi:hypothetical protein
MLWAIANMAGGLVTIYGAALMFIAINLGFGLIVMTLIWRDKR